MTIGFCKHMDFYDRVLSHTGISVKSHNALHKLFRNHDSVFGSLALLCSDSLSKRRDHESHVFCCFYCLLDIARYDGRIFYDKFFICR